MKTCQYLTEDEVNVLKSARKILKRLSKKHQKLADDANARCSSEKLDNFEAIVWREAKVDFIDDCNAFIDLL